MTNVYGSLDESKQVNDDWHREGLVGLVRVPSLKRMSCTRVGNQSLPNLNSTAAVDAHGNHRRWFESYSAFGTLPASAWQTAGGIALVVAAVSISVIRSRTPGKGIVSPFTRKPSMLIAHWLPCSACWLSGRPG
jgi:hypothetical protein